MAAGSAAESGAKVVLLEKNGTVGRKLNITGKGRGNITNIAELNEFVAAFGLSGKFLYGAFSRFSNNDLISLMENLGVRTKIERGGRVFPESDRASDVTEALRKRALDSGVEIKTGVKVKGLAVKDSEIQGVEVFSGVMSADAAILATGGITYPKTGSTGDGYRMAAEAGHTVIKPVQSLSALVTEEKWPAKIQGVSLKNVSATLLANGKKIKAEFGEMLFTHFGVSGPIILTLSKTYAAMEDKTDVAVSINLKPALEREQLDRRLIADFAQTKQFKTYLRELLPASMAPVFAEVCIIPGDLPINKITSAQRARIVETLTGMRLKVTGASSADEAIVTAGGVSVKEIDPRTMESKIIKGLYFAGEVIDVDAVTGGFNLQAAFSTGHVAGISCASYNE